MADCQSEIEKKEIDNGIVSYVVIDKDNIPNEDYPRNRYAAQLLPGGTLQLVEWNGQQSNGGAVESGIEEAGQSEWNEIEDDDQIERDTRQQLVSSTLEVEECTTEKQQAALWTKLGTKLLLTLYEEKKQFLGTVFLKHKHMWHAITEEMRAKGYPYNEVQVECKWKSLLRAFRNATDYNRKTTRGRRTCQFQTELENILSKEKTVEPLVIIDSSRVMTTSENDVDVSDDSLSERTESFQSDSATFIASNRNRAESTLCAEIRLLREQMKSTYEEQQAKRTERELRKKERDEEKQKRHEEIMDLLRQLKNPSQNIPSKTSPLTTERREATTLSTEIKLLQEQIRKENDEREAKRIKMEQREEEREIERKKRHDKRIELLLQLKK